MQRSLAESIIADYFRQKTGIAAVYLFGSVAKGSARNDSDVDIGVLYEHPPEATLLGQPFADEAALGELLSRPAQLVVMNQAPPDLIHRILRDGILVVEPNRSHRIGFEVRARNLYFDLVPMMRQYRERVRA